MWSNPSYAKKKNKIADKVNEHHLPLNISGLSWVNPLSYLPGLVDGSQVRSPDNVSQFLRGAVINILDPAICYKAYGERWGPIPPSGAGSDPAIWCRIYGERWGPIPPSGAAPTARGEDSATLKDPVQQPQGPGQLQWPGLGEVTSGRVCITAFMSAL